MKKFFLRLDVWFVVISAVYILLTLLGLGPDLLNCFGPCSPSNAREIYGIPPVALLGLFTPFGPNNFIFAFALSAPLWFLFGSENPTIAYIVTALLLIGIFFLLEKILGRLTAAPKKKVLLNLATLFAITMITDLITTQQPMSLIILLNSLGFSVGN